MAEHPWPADHVERRAVASLVPYARNARTHSDEQISQIMASIREFGWTIPVLCDESGGIIAGHGRVMAAMRLGVETVPVMLARGWSEAQRRAYVLADNQLTLAADWDKELLRIELGDLHAEGFDLDLLGFPADDLAALLHPPTSGLTDPDDVPEVIGPAVSRLGDLWRLGGHRLLCGDCTDEASAVRVLEGARADLCLTDPPYGLGGVIESGRNDYADYDDSAASLARLVEKWLPLARSVSPVVVFSVGVTGAWKYPSADWVMCWFYGGGPARIPWGRACWQPFLCYGKDPSLASGHGGRPDAVNLNVGANVDVDHPCPKPVKLWEWFFERLIFRPRALLFEPFSGSGTTIIAGEMTGHRVGALEISPRYVDVAVRRWQEFTGEAATLDGTGQTFTEVAAERLDAPAEEAA